jgi:methylmalonyl-CoA mutase cobalamin-binding domain/chain
MPASIAAAKAGVTTGEWAGEMRAVHGEYRGPTGVSKAVSNKTEGLDDIRARSMRCRQRLGRRLKFLVGKPGLDGHSNGAEQIAFRARDCGMDIAYEGIRLTPREIVDAAKEEGAHVVGLSILSGSHVPLVGELMKLMRAEGLGDIPVMVGGIIPDEDARTLAGLWRRAGLHAEGFRAESDHDGYRGAGSIAPSSPDLGEKSGSKGMPKYANPANPGPDLDRPWSAARLGEGGARQGQEPRRSRDLSDDGSHRRFARRHCRNGSDAGRSAAREMGGGDVPRRRALRQRGARHAGLHRHCGAGTG